MARYRKIRKWGCSSVILIHQEDMNDLNLKVGDFVDIEKIEKLKKELENGK